MRRRAALLSWTLVAAACGRLGFHDLDRGAGPDAPTDASSDDAHLHAAAGWSIALYRDLTGILPYNAADYIDGSGAEVLDNAPSYVTALAPPFTSAFAVLAGRTIIELAADGTATTHDYRPAVPDTTGPDQLGHALVATLGGQGGLWIACASLRGGDGLYAVDATWAIRRDLSDNVDGRYNNLLPLALDSTGAFDGRGQPALYVVEDSSYQLMRRTAAGSATTLTMLPNATEDLAAVGSALFAVVDNGSGDAVTLDRIDGGPTYPVTVLAAATSIALAEGSTAAGLFGVENGTTLAALDLAGSGATSIAWSSDPAWVWVAVSAPPAGHPLAGSLVVLESNRALDRDRLLVIAPR